MSALISLPAVTTAEQALSLELFLLARLDEVELKTEERELVLAVEELERRFPDAYDSCEPHTLCSTLSSRSAMCEGFSPILRSTRAPSSSACCSMPRE